MDINTWIQMGVREQLEYLRDTPDNEILLFMTKLCSKMLEQSHTIIRCIDDRRKISSKLSNVPNMKSIEKHAMERMCMLCKSKIEE
ncbi:MAG: hypothetical protein ACT6FG_00045 [Methanosarcinaceae archaeon]